MKRFFYIRYRIRVCRLALSNFPRAVHLFKRPLIGTGRIMFGRIPFDVEFKDGHKFKHYDPFKFYDIRSQPYADFTYDFNGTHIKIIHAERGDVEGVFVAKAYAWLPVKDRIVLDIGANIGDSAIWFALNGAKHVYAFEVVPSTAELCRKNVEINNLGDKITVLNVGVGKPGKIKIPADMVADGAFQVNRNAVDGIEVEVRSLDDLLNELSIDSAVLKIDCEGCEYEVINEQSINALKKFSHIIGEYHYGFTRIKQVLEKAGFYFECSKPEPLFALYNTPQEAWTGQFKAIRREA